MEAGCVCPNWEDDCSKQSKLLVRSLESKLLVRSLESKLLVRSLESKLLARSLESYPLSTELLCRGKVWHDELEDWRMSGGLSE